MHVADNQVVAADRAGASTVLVPRPATGVTLNVPAMAPDGQRVAYVEQQGTRADLKVDGRAVTQGQDVFLFTPEWTGADGILYTADGGIRTVVPSTGATSEVPFSADVRLTGRTYPRRSTTSTPAHHVVCPGCSPRRCRPTAGACSSSRSTTCG